ncbi:histidine phosphatase family protein [Actinoallomurus liliacearum]|uniref:Histidine phosphatase family protein n=1 Tax=Actinoallomurus liliacearum TaxID=1080073 RepID=A0ABP8TUH5_9ACTN
MGELILLRHGETEWARTGRHTGRTDVPLTSHGEEQAKALAPIIAARDVTRTLTSPAQRARRTAELAGLTEGDVDDRLWEWDYGAYEGRTTPDIRRDRPGWYLWSDGVPEGETAEQVGARTDAVIERVRPYLAEGNVALVAHGHVLRVLTARWLGLPPADGRLFRLDTGTVSALGTEHDRPVIGSWNVPAR